ncbi:ribosylnicotinamide kinase, partial [Ceratobasidium sp. 370]
DFWAPSDEIPIHPVYGVPDLEDPPTTIDWPVFREVFKRLRSAEPFEYSCPEWSGAGSPLPLSTGTLPDSMLDEWGNQFRQVEKERMSQGIKVEWRIVEGFVLYYEPDIIKDIDVPIFLRSPGHVLQKRGSGRQCPQIDGTVWVAPPEYWDQLTYPAYIRAHSHLFRDGDVEQGNPIEFFNLVVLDGEGTERNLSFQDIFTMTASAILRAS